MIDQTQNYMVHLAKAGKREFICYTVIKEMSLVRKLDQHVIMIFMIEKFT